MTERTVVTDTQIPVTDEGLRALVAQLIQRVNDLEAQVADLESCRAVPEDVLVAIGAAVSAYLGYNAKVRAVHVRGGNRWAIETRRQVHDRSVTRR